MTDEKHTECQQGQDLLSESILYTAERSENILFEIKEKVMPLHGKLWHDWCKFDKEIKSGSPNSMDENMRNQIECRKLQVGQINKQVMLLLEQLLAHDNITVCRYFLTWLQIQWNNIKWQVLPSLRSTYQQKWLAFCSKQGISKEELQKVESNLKNATLGLEHFFRELGQIYEATIEYVPDENSTSLEQDKSPARYNDIVKRLPAFVAKLLLNGHPVELIDGDAAHIPLTWITAIMNCLDEMIGIANIYVISALGIQSTGKSTLLKTMFGVDFASSADRSTHGAIMQLIPVEESQDLNYEYILLLDTDGLGAPTENARRGLQLDTLLATMAVGLGSTVLINTFGEGFAEMQKILENVKHTFRNITDMKIRPFFYFVHHNVTMEDSSDAVRQSIVKLIGQLECINISGEKSMNKKKFFSFEENVWTHNLPHLWKGNPPMAPINHIYGEKVSTLKQAILTKPNNMQDCKCLTVKTLSIKINDLWNRLLKDKFMFE